MELLFYKVENHLDYDRHEFEDCANKEQVMRKVEKLNEDEYIIYDAAYYHGSSPFRNLADLETDYNDECLDGGWWLFVII